MRSPKEFYALAKEVYRKKGLGGLIVTTSRFVLRKLNIRVKKTEQTDYDKARSIFGDVLFINGTDLPHPQRYRVHHQIEQLRAQGLIASEIYCANLNIDLVNNYRTFIFFRCPNSKIIEEFISVAKKNNKSVLFDVDDLIIDTRYTKDIPYIKNMKNSERESYELGVRKIGETLRLCDAAITTTDKLSNELKKYVPNVIINRNVASEEMILLSEIAYSERYKNNQKSDCILGYFSGSITHNSDFELILPSLIKILKQYAFVKLLIVGYLSIPDELTQFADRIEVISFINWRQLPKLISSIDVNLAPLENSIFNEAKSENKWIEAALVRVPTVASNVGAFAKMIVHQETGILCDDVADWERGLEKLIMDPSLRESIGIDAYHFVMENCATLKTSKNIAEFVRTVRKPNIAFILPSLNTSGGVLVALKHCQIMKNAGFDAMVINVQAEVKALIDNEQLCVIPALSTSIQGQIDKCVATLWTTVAIMNSLPRVSEKYYLVQGYETDFYKHGDERRILANSTYCIYDDLNYVTISKWCQKWLETEYDQHPEFVANGISVEKFIFNERDFSGKIRILIEGNCDSFYKNIDESFEITNRLDKTKYEIWYMANIGEPREWYQYDQFFSKVPHEKVSEIYEKCHILLKTSILESFSYPPLEMMCTGGLVVALSNEGNSEYLVDNKNCLLFSKGDINGAIDAIVRISEDAELRNRLVINGIKTAENRNWEKIKPQIRSLYTGYK